MKWELGCVGIPLDRFRILYLQFASLPDVVDIACSHNNKQPLHS